MDKTTEQLVSYTTGFSQSEMTEPIRNMTVDHLFDSIACAVAGSDSEPAEIAARVARTVHSDNGATVFAFNCKSSPELAALANAMMVRTYDYNDTAIGGHSSDMIGGILAAGEVSHSSGIEVLTAIALAYEIVGGLSNEGRPGFDGFDQGIFMQVGCALAVGKLWGFNEEQLANASSLALVTNLPLGAVRWGTLSMMKGCATAFATRNGVFSAMLAKEGFTSAPEPYEGIRGLHHITGPQELRLPLNPGGRRVIEMTYMKPIPAEGNTIGTVELVPKIKAFTPVDEIASIDLEVPEMFAIHIGDPPKYDPKNRETADHSFPFILAAALVDGGITFDSYLPARIADPALRPLMHKIRVIGAKELTDLRRESGKDGAAPQYRPVRVTVRTTSGREFSELVLDWTGHPDRKPPRDMFNRKLDICARGLPAEKREAIREAWWNVANVSDIGEPLKSMASFRSL